MFDFFTEPDMSPQGAGDFRYQIHEAQLARRLNIDLKHPIRVFNLDGLGLDEALLLQLLRPSFESLSWDYYDSVNEKLRILKEAFPQRSNVLDCLWDTSGQPQEADELLEPFVNLLHPADQSRIQRIRPYRKRAIATFILDRWDSPDDWHVRRIPTGLFTQKKNNFNSQPRLFTEIPFKITQHPEFLKLMRHLALLVESCRPGIRQIQAHCHQVSVHAHPDWPGHNSPEGIHQDGSDFIVSALVVERRGIEGGVSTVYGEDQETVYLNHCLNPGEGLFQADEGSPLFHNVSAIRAVPPFQEGKHFRNLIGFDFKILG